MPQTSPMNWLVISISFLIMISFLLSFNLNKTSKKKTMMKNKNILWKW